MASGDRPGTSPPADAGGGSASSSKGMKKSNKPTRQEQSERFKEAARELEVDESGEAFERSLSRILVERRKRTSD